METRSKRQRGAKPNSDFRQIRHIRIHCQSIGTRSQSNLSACKSDRRLHIPYRRNGLPLPQRQKRLYSVELHGDKTDVYLSGNNAMCSGQMAKQTVVYPAGTGSVLRNQYLTHYLSDTYYQEPLQSFPSDAPLHSEVSILYTYVPDMGSVGREIQKH